MADHFCGPRAPAGPASDTSDVVVSLGTEGPGRLVLVLDVFPIAAPAALFGLGVDHVTQPAAPPPLSPHLCSSDPDLAGVLAAAPAPPLEAASS